MYRAIVYIGLVVALDSLFGLIIPQSASMMTAFLPIGNFAIVALIAALVLAYFGIGKLLRRLGFKIFAGIIGVSF